jgi:hypothetical protein
MGLGIAHILFYLLI